MVRVIERLRPDGKLVSMEKSSKLRRGDFSYLEIAVCFAGEICELEVCLKDC